MGDRLSVPGPLRGLDVALILVALPLLASGQLLGRDTVAGFETISLVRVGVYALLIGSSSIVVVFGLRYFTGDAFDESGGDIDQDTGWLIGKLENALVLTFVIQGAYTALSIVFAAKSFIRRDDISSGNTTYYVAGTLLNFTYSVIFSEVAVAVGGL